MQNQEVRSENPLSNLSSDSSLPYVQSYFEYINSSKEKTSNSNFNGQDSSFVSNSSTDKTYFSSSENHNLNTTDFLLDEIDNNGKSQAFSAEILGDNVKAIPKDSPMAVPVSQPDAWSITIDKKILKSMSSKDIKRQDHIWELIQTERNHCQTLNIMQEIFNNGLASELILNQEQLDHIFPKLTDIVEVHSIFLKRFTERQNNREDLSIQYIGDILLEQFDGSIGEKMKRAYGEFCSKHKEAVQLYKQYLKSDKKFEDFVKKHSYSNISKRLSIPECILLVTQRVTKYPLLIEAIIKATKESHPDHLALQNSLVLVKSMLNFIDAQIDSREKEHRFIDIYNRIDARSLGIFKGLKFTKSDLFSQNRKLLHEGHLRWISARGKFYEVTAIILTDVILFLQEYNQKLTFFTTDNKSNVVSLSKLIVREKSDTRENKGIYLICQNKAEPEMYEFICKNAEERRFWIKIIRDAINSYQEDDFSTQKMELTTEKAISKACIQSIHDSLKVMKQNDEQIYSCCSAKINAAKNILDNYQKDISMSIKLNHLLNSDGEKYNIGDLNTEQIITSVLDEVTNLLSVIQPKCSITLGDLKQNFNDCKRSVSPTRLPKRAESFSGFDIKERANYLKKKFNSNKEDSNDVKNINSLKLFKSSDNLHSETNSLSINTDQKATICSLITIKSVARIKHG